MMILSDKSLTKKYSNHYLFWSDFDYASKVLYEYIKDMDFQNVGIIGVARGGLPLLVAMSHLLNIRDVSIFQVKMNKSDMPNDYGDAFISNCYINDNYDKYILFEDIIYKGNSSLEVVNYLKAKNKRVIGIYSLVMDEGFNKNNDFKDIDVKSVFMVVKDEWVKFPWET